MQYGISVKVKSIFNTNVWELHNPAKKCPAPFFNTKEEAESIIRMCYPDSTKEEVKVIKLP